VEKIYQTYRKGFQPLMMVGAIFEVPFAAYAYATAAPSSPTASFVFTVIELVAAFFMYGILTLAADDLLEGRGIPRPGEPFARIIPRIPVLLVLLFVLAVVTSIGFALLVIPGIWVSVVLSLAPPAAVLGQTGAFAAIKESARLVRGRFWPVLGVLVVVGLFTALVPIILELPFVLGTMTTGIGDTNPFVAIYEAAVSLLVLPIAPIALTVLYRSLEGTHDHGEVTTDTRDA